MAETTADTDFDYTRHDRHVERGRALLMIAGLLALAAAQLAVVAYATGIDIGPGRTVARVEPAASTAAAVAATRFAAAEAAPAFTAPPAGSGIGVTFRPGAAVASIDFNAPAPAMFAPDAFAFSAGSVVIGLGAAPRIYDDFRPVPAPAAPRMYAGQADRPAPAANSDRPHDNVAALADYLGRDGLARAGARCAALMGEAYRFDAGMMDLCRQIRTNVDASRFGSGQPA